VIWGICKTPLKAVVQLPFCGYNSYVHIEVVPHHGRLGEGQSFVRTCYLSAPKGEHHRLSVRPALHVHEKSGSSDACFISKIHLQEARKHSGLLMSAQTVRYSIRNFKRLRRYRNLLVRKLITHQFFSASATHPPTFTSHHTSFTTETSLVPGAIATAASTIARVTVSTSIISPAVFTIRLLTSKRTRHVGGATVAVLITPAVTLSALR
jgi:hypothetical protein